MNSQRAVSTGSTSGGFPLYKTFFLNDLGIDGDFLEVRANTIRERLARAVDEMSRDHSNIFAVNMCLHAASSIVLSKPDHLGTTLEKIRSTPGLDKKDPTTVLTVSALYYLVDWDTRRAEEERQAAQDKAGSDTAALQENRLKTLRSSLDEINWMIGEDAMQVLGLNKLNKMRPSI